MTTRFSPKAALACAALVATGLGLTAAAQDDDSQFIRNTDAQSRVCFRVDQVDGFAAVRFDQGVDGVNLRVRREVYQLKFAAPCPSIREATQVAVDSRQPAYVCSGADADIVAFSRVTGAERCHVSGMRLIEPSEVAALPSRERP